MQIWNIVAHYKFRIIGMFRQISLEKRMIKERIKMVCCACNSEMVSRDAWAKWDKDCQNWVLDQIFDDSYCHDCQQDRAIIESPVTAP